jgi:hypothetical protein
VAFYDVQHPVWTPWVADGTREEGDLFSTAEEWWWSKRSNLVVLGATGTGKGVLVMHLVLELLRLRRPGQPVPVPIGPDHHSGDVEAALLRTLRAFKVPRAAARRLLAANLLLPVLDGTDDFAAHGLPAPDVLLRSAAEWTATGRPMVVTARPEVYDAGPPLPDAFVVRLAKWDPLYFIFSGIQDEQLQTPLMAHVAWSVEPGAVRPGDDLRPALLDAYLEAEYRTGPYDVTRVRRWLRFLARRTLTRVNYGPAAWIGALGCLLGLSSLVRGWGTGEWLAVQGALVASAFVLGAAARRVKGELAVGAVGVFGAAVVAAPGIAAVAVCGVAAVLVGVHEVVRRPWASSALVWAGWFSVGAALLRLGIPVDGRSTGLLFAGLPLVWLVAYLLRRVDMVVYAAAGRLPWRYRRFLRDAMRRGILLAPRDAVYFRHEVLRQHLAR